MTIAFRRENALDRPAMQVRELSADGDRDCVRAFYDRVSDYVRMESGREPDDGVVRDFFSDCPPGKDPAKSLKLGLAGDDGRLAGLADMAFGYPRASDAYIGLLLIDCACRGRGLGHSFLGWLTDTACAAGSDRMLVAVLAENTRGRAFWEREGFSLERSFPAAMIGDKMHVRHRLQRPCPGKNGARGLRAGPAGRSDER
ncbi:GNAT family N-acetyltransferase [Mesorhizobium sp. CN2-181]|uniref:GNAT family N-acetyltransferase n=1 Tax=Mesorhizobium yinganensis TaxID=3157707 RepID=UPI0032B730F2